jgi:hypothetical protein
MASEDSGQPIGSSIPATTVHPEGHGLETLEALLMEMLSTLHCPDDLSERLALKTLLAEEG